MTPPNVGIVGYGFVGRAVAAGFPSCNVLVNDPQSPISVSLERLAKECRIIFICVPTPMEGDGGPVHTEIVANVLFELDKVVNADPKFAPLICIKSTVPPEALAHWRHATTRLRLTMSPEYLRERDAAESFIHAKLLVVGADNTADAEDVIQFFEQHSICDKCPTYVLDFVGAGIVKYMENTFLAMKVTFMNEWYKIFKETETVSSWPEIVAAFHGDERLGNSHGLVPGPDGKRGFGGKCLPKDLAGAIWTARFYALDTPLLDAVDGANRTVYRPEKDWVSNPGAVKP